MSQGYTIVDKAGNKTVIVAKNLNNVVVSTKFLDRLCKMVIMDNPYLDKESAEILSQYIDDLRATIVSQDEIIAALRDNIAEKNN